MANLYYDSQSSELTSLSFDLTSLSFLFIAPLYVASSRAYIYPNCLLALIPQEPLFSTQLLLENNYFVSVHTTF
jgi:hypothetical protein